MITVISGTNRQGSATLKFANHITNELREKTYEPVELLSLEDLPMSTFTPDMYANQPKAIAKIQDEKLLPAEKFIIVTPEYNGSIPGVVKLLIDACSVRQLKATFTGKKAALFGVASGRAGNLRGMEHLTAMLHHVGVTVHPNRLPISGIDKILNESGEVAEENTKKAVSDLIDAFLAY